MIAGLIVHGGAGALDESRHARVLAGVTTACARGVAILRAGGAALDAVTACVRALEDDDAFNAGRGSALTRDGTVETDAAIACGASRRIGAVGAVPDLGAAIALARAVLERGEHALLVGPAALEFAAEVGIAAAPPGALVTERMRARLAAVASAPRDGGTVGAVAIDRDGRTAAATSTGGIVGKRRGRVGDSPIIGAGTWADARCAISATGDGEAILRVALARTIAARVELAGETIEGATIAALGELRAVTGGQAGAIAIAREGEAVALATRRSSAAMPVASWRGDDDEIRSSLADPA